LAQAKKKPALALYLVTEQATVRRYFKITLNDNVNNINTISRICEN